MASPPDRPDRSFRHARFAVPLPARDVADASERIRLVDATGSAAAWLGYGTALVVLGFFVRDDDGTWREVLHDRIVDAGEAPQTWSLVTRDPTMARVRRASAGHTFDVTAEIDEGILTIVGEGRVLLRVGPHGERCADAGHRDGP